MRLVNIIKPKLQDMSNMPEVAFCLLDRRKA